MNRKRAHIRKQTEHANTDTEGTGTSNWQLQQPHQTLRYNLQGADVLLETSASSASTTTRKALLPTWLHLFVHEIGPTHIIREVGMCGAMRSKRSLGT
jgi:hypothetical protein